MTHVRLFHPTGTGAAALVTFNGCRIYGPPVTAFLPRALLERS